MNRKSLVSIIILFSLSINLFTIRASAESIKSYQLPNGGSWTYTKPDPTVTKNWTTTTWRSAKPIQKVTFYSPKAVQILLNSLIDRIGVEKTKSIVKFGVETAASYGVQKTAQKLMAKYGATIGSSATIFLAYAGYTYTAVELIEDYATGISIKK